MLFILMIILIITSVDSAINNIDLEQDLNDRVIMGVLAQYPYEDNHQFIASSYVKFLESSGSRVVPIASGYPFEYYRKLLSHINGVLLPGGGSPLDQGPYADAVHHILDVAIQFNENGTHFPVWASCLSFEEMIVYYLNDTDLSWQSMCHVQNISLTLDIEKSVLDHPESTQMFREMNETMPNIIEILQEHNVTANYHRVCIDLDEWEKHPQLTNNFNIISINQYNNHTFVSTVEHKKYPIFGSMWHPEKNQFEFVVNNHVGHINHDRYAIMAGQYFANLLVNEARKNCLGFPNKLIESEHLIYNYDQYLQYTGKDPKSSYEEIYKFPVEFNNGGPSGSMISINTIIESFFLITISSFLSPLPFQI